MDYAEEVCRPAIFPALEAARRDRLTPGEDGRRGQPDNGWCSSDEPLRGRLQADCPLSHQEGKTVRHEWGTCSGAVSAGTSNWSRRPSEHIIAATGGYGDGSHPLEVKTSVPPPARAVRHSGERCRREDARILAVASHRAGQPAARRRLKGAPMAGLTAKNIAKPEEVREMKDGKGRVELVDLGSGLVARATFEPGWAGPNTSSLWLGPTAARQRTWDT